MPTPSINFNCFCYVLNILLSNRLGKALLEIWYFPVCLYKCNGETGVGALGLGRKEWDFVPAEASSEFADEEQVLIALQLGGPETQREGV